MRAFLCLQSCVCLCICSTELHLAHGGLVRFVGIELLLHELGKLQVALKVPASHHFICQYWYLEGVRLSLK